MKRRVAGSADARALVRVGRVTAAMVAAFLLANASCARARATPPPLASPKPPPVVVPAAAPPPAAVTPPPPPSPEDKQSALIKKTLKRVSKARHLSATKEVPGVFMTREALIARVKEHVAKEVPHEAIRQEGMVLQLLGFIPTRFDYEKETYALLEDELAGFYEPSDGTMYMAADLDADNAKATLDHELDHALQDQHWDLAKRSAYEPGQGDKASAFSSLAEGDATSTMADLLVASARPGATALDLPEDLFNAQVIGAMSNGPAAKAPHIMRASLVAPYIDGTMFVHALRRKGGWAAVDAAWENPPVTSEQILHVEKWEKHEPALAIGDPPIHTLGEGWSVLDSDAYGELGVRLSLGEWVGAVEAPDLATGWGGDRGVLYGNGDKIAFAWRVRFDEAPGKAPDALANRTWSKLSTALQAKLGSKGGRDPKVFCVSRPETGPLLVTRAGRDLVFLVGPAKVAASGWASAGTCDSSAAWLREVLHPKATSGGPSELLGVRPQTPGAPTVATH